MSKPLPKSLSWENESVCRKSVNKSDDLLEDVKPERWYLKGKKYYSVGNKY